VAEKILPRTLYRLTAKQFEVVALLTTVNEETELSSMHAIPFSLLMKQAESIGIPLYPVFLPKNLPVYEQRMLDAAQHFKAQGRTFYFW
jgi:diphthamide synthase (EF-2-diphthine--ammonia ligase)